MAKIIEFKVVKPQKETDQKHTAMRMHQPDAAHRRDITHECDSPIRVDYREEGSVYVGFHKACFSMPFLEYSLQGLAYGETPVWELYRLNDKSGKSKYLTYAVVLTGEPTEDDRSILTTIVDRITKKVYLKEIRRWSNEVEISDLTKPYQYRLEDGVNVSAMTIATLKNAGLAEVGDLIDATREELCRLPGMTTIEVARLEKALASRGLFLKTADVPIA